MMSIPMRRAWQAAEKYDKALKLRDFNGTVLIVGRSDGSQFLFQNAIVKKWQDPESNEFWYLVFTEHYGNHVYSADWDDYAGYQFTRHEIETISNEHNAT